MRVLAAAVLSLLLASAAARAQDQAMDQRVKPCAACHGEGGHSRDEVYYPSIAGKPQGYLQQQLRNFREGRRHNTVMAELLAPLSDDYLRAIAAYYAQQPPTRAAREPAADAALLARGAKLVREGDAARQLPACSRCHGGQLAGVQPAIPSLAGLGRDYLSAQLGAWRSGVRQALAPDCMAQIARKLDEAEINALSAYIAALPVNAQTRAAEHPDGKLPLDCGGVP